MSTDANKSIALDVMERGFNQGDLSVVDAYHLEDTVDHQEPPGTQFIPHLKEVITAMRTAFPDLHFEVHDIIAEGDLVAFRSTMTGTHTGILSLGQIRGLPPTGRQVSVPHLHFIRMIDGKTLDLWHQWNILMMMQQLGVAPMQAPSRA